MGFWKNTKIAVNSTFKACTTSMELLSNGAKSLEEYSHSLLLKQKIASVENSNSISFENYKQIVNLYIELFEECPKTISVHEIDNIIKLANKFSGSISLESTFHLPKVIIYYCDIFSELLKIAKRYCLSNLISSQQKLIQNELDTLDGLIKKLELKRRAVKSLHYENGNKMYEYEVYDGQKHGNYKRWYENGQLKCFLRFDKGTWVSDAEYFRPNGSIYSVSSKTVNGTAFSIFTEEGYLVVEIFLNLDGSIDFTLLPEQRKSLKLKQKRNGKFSKISLIAYLLLTPRNWSFFWYYSRRVEVKDLLSQAVEESSKFGEFIKNFEFYTSK